MLSYEIKKGLVILHEQLLQQQLAAQANSSIYNKLPPHIATTLDDMAFGISQKEDLSSYDVKQKLVKNINNLSPNDAQYLEEQMSLLINKSVHEEENIDENTVDKNFISFLIKLYY